MFPQNYNLGKWQHRIIIRIHTICTHMWTVKIHYIKVWLKAKDVTEHFYIELRKYMTHEYKLQNGAWCEWLFKVECLVEYWKQ